MIDDTQVINLFYNIPILKKYVLGMRFGIINVKVGIANILSNYELLPGKETPSKINYSKKTLFLASDVGLPIIYKKITAAPA